MRTILLAGAFCALTTAAWADPPSVGDRMIAAKALICDTKDQVMDLYAATKTDGGKGVVPKYLRYNGLIDKAGEPTCNMQPIIAPVKSVEDLGVSRIYSGNSVHGWLIEITGADGASGWVLYGEAGPPETAV